MGTRSARSGGRARRLSGDADAGAALVEFALLLPFLAIVVFGTVDIGRGYQMKNRLTNMAREGAFYAQFNPGRVDCATGDDIVAKAQSEDAGLAGSATVTVSTRSGGALTPITGCSTTVVAGTDLVVRVTAPMTILTPLVGAITGSPVIVGGYAEVVVQV